MNDYRNHPLYRKHDLDSAMGSLWSFYKTNFLSLFAISLVISLIIQYATSLLDLQEMQNTADIEVFLGKIREIMLPLLGIVVISLIFTVILQHYVIFKPIDEGNSILDSCIRSLKYYVPFLIIMILLAFFGAIAMVLGVIALIIGALFAAVYILLLYVFILPVLMIEGPNIGNVISRTFTLAHRNFWQNIGMVAVFLIILIVVSLILSAIIMIPFTGSMLKSIFNPGEEISAGYTRNPLFIILSSLVNAVTLPLVPIFSCIMYFNGKAREDEIATRPNEPSEYRPSIEDLYSGPKDEVDK